MASTRPRGYLGHTGSVTVVTHNVITSGQLPKHMGWTERGLPRRRQRPRRRRARQPERPLHHQRHVDGRPDQAAASRRVPEAGRLPRDRGAVAPSSSRSARRPTPHTHSAAKEVGLDHPVQQHDVCHSRPRGPPRAPLQLAASWWGVGIPSEDPAPRPTAPTGSGCTTATTLYNYDTDQLPALLYPLDGDRYTTGHDIAHEGGDVWAADAAVKMIESDRRLERHLRDPAGRRQGGARAGRRQLPRSGERRRRPDDPHGRGDGDRGRAGREDPGRARGHELDNTLVVLTADHGSVSVASGTSTATTSRRKDYGFFNWYYGDVENDPVCLRPAAGGPAPLIETGTSGSLHRLHAAEWPKDQSPEVGKLTGGHARPARGHRRVGARRRPLHAGFTGPLGPDEDRRRTPAWFDKHAQELVDTEAAPYGPDVIATLAGQHDVLGPGRPRRHPAGHPEIPILFAGAGLSSQDLQVPSGPWT